MRYHSNHAASSDSVPFMLRGPKSVRTVLSAAVAGAVGLVPVFMLSAPAEAVASTVVGFTNTTPSVSEGAGSVTLPITWNTTGTPTGVTWSTADVTATAPSDYTATTNGTLNWSGTGNTATSSITVPIVDDSLNEASETFTVTLTDASSNTATATVTITDNDSPPTYTMVANKTTVTEGTDTAVTVTMTLSHASGQSISIPVSTANGTATAGSDYTTYSTPVVFNPNDTVKTFQVLITDDSIDEDDQTFQIVASAGTNVTGIANPITITIVDNDAAPTVQFDTNTASATEGSDVSFNLTLSPASQRTVTVKYDTSDLASGQQLTPADGLATAGSDYTAVTAGTVTFAPGVTTMAVPVHTTVDNLDETSPEEFKATLSAPSNATLGTLVTAYGKIADPTGTTAPSITLSPKIVDEGNSTSSKTFTVTLSKASGRTQVVHWNAGTATGQTATADVDYKTGDGDLVFAPGVLTKTFTVDVIGDIANEGNENFTITLGNGTVNGVTGTIATGGDLTANTITITDDDAPPTFSYGNLSLKEGDTASAQLLPIKLSNPSGHDLLFNVAVSATAHTTAATPATANNTNSTVPGMNDYHLLTSTVTIPAGATTGYVVVLDNGDTVYEADEMAYIDVTPDSGTTGWITTPAMQEATLTLLNDDKAPNLEINSITGNEGDTVHVTGTVTGVAQDETVVTVSFNGASVNGSKAADASDFTNPGSMIAYIDPGQTLVPVADVVLTDDTTAEPAETILVTGMGLGNSGTVTSGVITIAASDGGTTGPTGPTGPTNPSGTLTLAADKTIVQGVGSVNLHGNTTAGASVQLWAKPVGNPTLVTYGDPVTADSDGDYSFNAPLTKNGIIFATTVGDMTSDQVTVYLQELPTIAGGSTAKGKVSLTVTTGNPGITGGVVTIQVANADGSWSTVASGTTNSAGKWTKTWTGLKSGSSTTYRAWAAGKGPIGLLSGNSATKVVKVM